MEHRISATTSSLCSSTVTTWLLQNDKICILFENIYHRFLFQKTWGEQTDSKNKHKKHLSAVEEIKKNKQNTKCKKKKRYLLSTYSMILGNKNYCWRMSLETEIQIEHRFCVQKKKTWYIKIANFNPFFAVHKNST